jgi:cytoskeletal protein CcmA (bactofilin family)
MFSNYSKKMAKNNEQESQAYNLIDAGTVLNGDIKTEGNIRIDGTLIGSLHAKGKLVVGASGKVEGEIFCNNADISGKIKAKITVTELLSLKSTANLTGEITTNKLAIEPGANFTGSCSMGAVIKEMSHGEKQRKELVAEESKTA